MAGRKNGAIRATMRDGAKLNRRLQQYDKKAENVLKRSVSDFRSRAPGWIRTGVRKFYNIEPGDIDSAGPRIKKGTTVSIGGREVDGATLEYKGKMLTTPRFSQNPQARPAGLPYQIHVTVVKGKRGTLPHDTFLTKKFGALPFQRKGKERKPMQIIKAIAVPEMIGSKRASETINQMVYERIEKRVQNHIKVALK